MVETVKLGRRGYNAVPLMDRVPEGTYVTPGTKGAQGVLVFKGARPPAWAVALVQKTLKAETRPGSYRFVTLSWRRSNRDIYSSGRAWTHRVHVTEGADLRDAAYVLLHELAHFLVGYGHHHDATFWRKCFSLAETYGLLEKAFNRDCGYRGGDKYAWEFGFREPPKGERRQMIELPPFEGEVGIAGLLATRVNARSRKG